MKYHTKNLLLDALCSYFEEEELLTKSQQELFRKNWILEEQMNGK